MLYGPSMYVVRTMTKLELETLTDYMNTTAKEGRCNMDFAHQRHHLRRRDHAAAYYYGVHDDHLQRGWTCGGMGYFKYHSAFLDELFDSEMPDVEKEAAFFFSGHYVLFHNDKSQARYQWMFIEQNEAEHRLIVQCGRHKISIIPKRGDIVFMDAHRMHSLVPGKETRDDVHKLKFYAITYNVT